MADFISLSGFLATLDVERARWDDLLDQISPAWMLLPLPGTTWTVKDTIAHISWYEREMVAMLRARALTGSDWWALPAGERNQAIYRAALARSLDDVLAEAAASYLEMAREIKKLSDQDLNDPARFKGMPDDWLPWDVLAQNSYQHYREHMPRIRAWLDSF